VSAAFFRDQDFIGDQVVDVVCGHGRRIAEVIDLKGRGAQRNGIVARKFEGNPRRCQKLLQRLGWRLCATHAMRGESPNQRGVVENLQLSKVGQLHQRLLQ